MSREQKDQSRLPALVMGLQGLLILGMWGASIAGGVFKTGVKTVENNMYLALHVAAETAMGVLLLVGSVALLAGRRWGRAIGLLGLGSVVYSTVNSLADTVRNKPRLTPVLVINLLLAVFIAGKLLRATEPKRKR